ncbi:hypothetical protein WJX73_006336 [Symbiochloris irregularis]|uniref:Uncharacterized protein n=1 Tax=Symbiochloris irregularis TaxID=706552 RepID=A0AAW1PRY2_9CHLO
MLVALFVVALSATVWPSAHSLPLSTHSDVQSLAHKHQVPKWPAQYQVSWSLTIPFITKLQSTPFVYNYTVHQDTLNGRQLSTRDGVESVLQIVDTNTMYQIYPKVDTWDCRTLEIDGGGGPTAQQRRRLLSVENGPKLTLVLPDLSEGKWTFNGTSKIRTGAWAGLEADTYVWPLTEDYGYGRVSASYAFYVSQGGSPLRLEMWGVNLYTGGHFDDYEVDFRNFSAGSPPTDIFKIPDICPLKPSVRDSYVGRMQMRHSGLMRHLAIMHPNAHWGDAEYDAFVHRHGRRHRSEEEYQGRAQVFMDNQRMIEQHNAGNHSYKLELNHFADWTREEYRAVFLPNTGAPRLSPQGDSSLVRQHVRTVPAHMVPNTLDWRGSPADSPVKDQAMCGGCWAFGAVASLEAAYFRQTGKQLLLSEQNMMDCSWSTGNTACMGGFQDLAFQWVLNNTVGGLASEEAYPYQGVTNFCRKDVPQAAKFSGKYVEVTGGEEALKEALYTKGPMTVSVDAGPDAFQFYKSGVFDEAKCQTQLDKLDHAVIISGYGTSPEGQHYWLVKNTWSTNWGDKGYIQIARQPDDCGIASQPIYIDFDHVE